MAAGSVARSESAGVAFWIPLAIGFAVLAIPTFVSVGKQTWSTDIGAHGPIVIATGAWLLFHDGPGLSDDARRGHNRLASAIILALSLAAYCAGRAYDFVSIEFAGLYGVFISIAVRLFGFRKICANPFIYFYPALATPPPTWLLNTVTAPLQMLVSTLAEHLARLVGYPVERDGVILAVAQYQLLVEDACAGLNSIVGIVSVSLLYIYLVHRASWRHALLLIAAILPIAIAVNLVRILALIMITYHYGDAVAQGFLHSTTGVVIYVLGLALIFAVDKLMVGVSPRGKPL